MAQHLNESKEEQQKLLMAMLIVVVILFSFNFIFSTPTQTLTEEPVSAVLQNNQEQNKSTVDAEQKDFSFQAAVVPMENDFLSGNFNISNGGIETLYLTQYHETTQADSPTVQLLKPGYFWTDMEWTSSSAQMPKVSDTWQTNVAQLTPFTPLSLTYENDDVKINRVVTMDDAYMLTVTDTVYNLKSQPISVSLTGRVNRYVNLEDETRSVVHEGLLGLVDGTLVEKKYSDIEDEDFSDKTKNGWVGITEKYWQAIMIFDPSQDNARVSFSREKDIFTAQFNSSNDVIPVGGSIQKTTRIFAGAKKLNVINAYEKNLNIPKFDLSIDFGWFYFLTRPFLAFLNWLYTIVGNMGIAILIFATLLRIALLPIATKSYESMAKMRKIQPRIQQLQKQYKNNRMMLQQEMMKLYQREKINPAGGCLPMLIQIPVFYALYKVLSVSINMRQAPFFGWIHDLSMPDPSSVFTLFGYLDWPIPSFLNIGVWPILMGLTMWIQQKLNPAPSDKAQANMFKMMPIIFMFMMGHFASGLVIYWTWSNILSIAQQKYIMKKVGV